MTEIVQMIGREVKEFKGLRIKEAKMMNEKSRGYRTDPKNARIYIGLSRESVLDHLANRRFRPIKEFRKLLPEVFKSVGITDEEVKNYTICWSQKAGCSCGCSPGFVVQGLYDRNIYVTVELVE